MLSSRVLNVQRELLARFDRISNLWVAYHNCGKYPDDFGREFYHAVGKILQGYSLDKIELFHIGEPDPKKVTKGTKFVDASKVLQVVSYEEVFDRALNGKNKTMTEEKGTQECRKRKPRRRRKPSQKQKPSPKRKRR